MPAEIGPATGKCKLISLFENYGETPPASMYLKFARLVEDLRCKAGLTQAQLAERAGVSQPMIARLKRGDQDRIPTLSTISKVFGALG